MPARDDPTAEEVESRMRRLLSDADLPAPDEVRHENASRELLFIWHDRRVAIVIELDSGATGCPHAPPV
jgi:hypothetical protein